MTKTKKILLIIAAVLVVVLLAAVIAASLSLNTIVKAGVEKYGPQMTKTSVTLDEVNLSLLSGSAKVRNLVIGNPEGYKSTNAFSVGVVDVGVNPFSVLSSKIVIRKMHINSPEITLEGNPLSGNNLSQILQNVNESAKASGTKTTNAPAKAASPAKKFQVDDFILSGAKVHVLLNGSSKETLVTLPEIHLQNLGKNPEGITAADLSKNILSAVTSATIKAVASDPYSLGNDAGKAVDKVKKGINNLLGK